MLAFFSKLFALFLSKLAKTEVFVLCCESSITNIRFHFNYWFKNAVLQLRNCVALPLNQKVYCGSCSALQNIKKLNCAFCALRALLRCVFGVMLCVPASASNSNVSPSCWRLLGVQGLSTQTMGDFL